MTIYTEAPHVYIRIRVDGRDIEQMLLLKKPQHADYAASIIGAHAKNLKSDMEIPEPKEQEEVEEQKAEPKKKPFGRK